MGARPFVRPQWSALAASLALLALAGCAAQPVQLAPRYTPVGSASEATRSPARLVPCHILLASVTDLREDPQAAGVFGNRFVHAEDAPAWLRSGLLSISRVSDQPADDADVVINVELLKLYILTINEAKSANVVIRIHFSGPRGAPEERIYRGAFTSLNWTGAGDEARGALDTALSRALASVDRDLQTRCAAPPIDSPHR